LKRSPVRRRAQNVWVATDAPGLAKHVAKDGAGLGCGVDFNGDFSSQGTALGDAVNCP